VSVGPDWKDTTLTDFTTDTAIDGLAARVLDGSLPHGEWTHAAHFAFALWLIRHRPEAAGAEDFRRIIVALNERHGTPNTDNSGYHHTITVASLGAAALVLADCPAGAPLHAVLAKLLASPFGRSDWIFAHWSREHLFGVAARRGWIEPDLVPLPW